MRAFRNLKSAIRERDCTCSLRRHLRPPEQFAFDSCAQLVFADDAAFIAVPCFEPFREALQAFGTCEFAIFIEVECGHEGTREKIPGTKSTRSAAAARSTAGRTKFARGLTFRFAGELINDRSCARDDERFDGRDRRRKTSRPAESWRITRHIVFRCGRCIAWRTGW